MNKQTYENIGCVHNAKTWNGGIYSGYGVCHLKKHQARAYGYYALKLKWDLYGQMVGWRGFQAKRTAWPRHREGNGAVRGGEWWAGGHIWYFTCPCLSLASPAEATLLQVSLSLLSWEVSTAPCITYLFLLYPHCSFLLGKSEYPLSEELWRLWQVF